jgi:hypothetical protein
MNKQMSIFAQGQDLPLISQAPQRAKEQVFKPKVKPVQVSFIDAQCGLCLDTGLAGKERKVCICQK